MLNIAFCKTCRPCDSCRPRGDLGHYDFLMLQYICPLRSVAFSCNIKITKYVTIKYFGTNARVLLYLVTYLFSSMYVLILLRGDF